MAVKPRIAVHKFASCDGCQLTFLELEEDFFDLIEAVDIAYFMEATRDAQPGPYDITFVDGSVTTREEEERIKSIRADSKLLVSLGVCATHGGIQALRNFASVDRMVADVYPRPEWIDTLPTSKPHSAFVRVDLELQGCPINRHQLREVLTGMLAGKFPRMPSHSVCVECKRKGNICVLVLGIPCMGPVTHDGCGALCPTYHRGCYACFGPMDDPKPERFSKELELRGLSDQEILRRFREITSAARPFVEGAESYATATHQS
ncbi:MAG: oxidoreductase [Chloroflexi bacterium]|nr:oxidoreductase [Chloroflexota bacterium]